MSRRPEMTSRFDRAFKHICIAMVAVCASSCHGCGENNRTTSRRHPSQILREAIYSDPGSFDPREQSEAETFSILYPIYETLVRVDDDGTIAPLLSTSWEIDSGSRRIRFHLRPDVTFHPAACLGDADYMLSARDVQASIVRALSPGSTGRSLLSEVLVPPQPGTSNLAPTELIRVIDQHTVEFSFARSPQQLLERLALPYFFILPAKCIERSPSALKHTPVGTGPFVLTQVDAGKRVVLARNDHYWKHDGETALPRLAGIEFRVVPDRPTALAELLAGKLDAVEVPPTLARQLLQRDDSPYARFSALTADALDTHYLVFRTDRPPFKDNLPLRRALNYAVDKRRIVEHLLGGYALPSHGVFPPALFAERAPGAVYPHNTARAASLLEAAGYPQGSGLPVLTLGIDNRPETEAVAVFVKEQLAAIGVRVDLRVSDFSTLVTEAAQGVLDFFYLFVEGDHSGAFYAQQVSGPAPSEGGLNFAHLQAAPLARMKDQALSAPSVDAKRGSQWAPFNDLAVQQAPWLFLYHTKRLRLIDPALVDYEHGPMQIRRYLTTHFVR